MPRRSTGTIRARVYHLGSPSPAGSGEGASQTRPVGLGGASAPQDDMMGPVPSVKLPEPLRSVYRDRPMFNRPLIQARYAFLGCARFTTEETVIRNIARVACKGTDSMSLEIVAGLLGSQFVRAVASEVVSTLACQAIQYAVGTMTQPTPALPVSGRATASHDGMPALRALPTVEVMSVVPGCARLWVHGVRDDAARATEVETRVRTLDGVRAAEANPTTGTLLVHFDPTLLDVPALVAVLDPPARPCRISQPSSHLRLAVG